MHRLVLGALAQKDSVVLLARTLNKCRHHGVKLALVILVRRRLDNLDQTVKALKDNLMRGGVINFSCRGTGTLGVNKRVGLGIAHRLGKRERLLKVFLGLTREAHDDVGRKRNIGHTVTNTIDQAQIILARVPTIHLFKDARGTRLNGQVKLRHDGRRLGHSIDGLGQQIFGMRRGKEDTLDTRIAHSAQQIGKTRLAKEIATVGVNVLSQQRNLAHALTHKPGNLVDNLLEGTTLLTTTDVRHDAVRAEVVAARHDRHPGVILRLAMPRHTHGVGILMLIRTDMALAIQKRLGDKLGHVSNGMGAENDVDVIDVGEQALAIALGDAAAHGDNTLTRRRRRKALAGIALTIQARIGSLAHATRHKHNNIGMLGIERHKTAIRIEQTTHTLGVVLVHLAAECADKVGFTGKNIAYGTLVHELTS